MPLANDLIVEKARVLNAYTDEEQAEFRRKMSCTFPKDFKVSPAVHLHYDSNKPLPERLEVSAKDLELLTSPETRDKKIEVILFPFREIPKRGEDLHAEEYLIVGARIEKGQVITDNCRRLGEIYSEMVGGGTPQSYEMQARNFLFGRKPHGY